MDLHWSRVRFPAAPPSKAQVRDKIPSLGLSTSTPTSTNRVYDARHGLFAPAIVVTEASTTRGATRSRHGERADTRPILGGDHLEEGADDAADPR
jgi:hypothetical protein